MPRRTVTSWLSHAWARPEDILERFKMVMNPIKVEFDTLIGTGVSGAVIVPTLARLLEVDFAIVRKANDGSHGWNKVEGVVGEKWLFVDDLISTGATSRRVKYVMKDEHPHSVCVGAYLYDSQVFRAQDDMLESTE